MSSKRAISLQMQKIYSEKKFVITQTSSHHHIRIIDLIHLKKPSIIAISDIKSKNSDEWIEINYALAGYVMYATDFKNN